MGGITTPATGITSASIPSTSGTVIDFNSLPSWVRRITVTFVGVSTNGGAVTMFQLGTSGGIQTTGYFSTGIVTGSSSGTSTSGLVTDHAIVASNVRDGIYILTKVSGNLWAMSGAGMLTDVVYQTCGAGHVTLSDTLTTLRVTTTNGTDSFDAGMIGVLYE